MENVISKAEQIEGMQVGVVSAMDKHNGMEYGSKINKNISSSWSEQGICINKGMKGRPKMAACNIDLLSMSLMIMFTHDLVVTHI